MQTATKTYGIFINGEWLSADGGKEFAVRNPATSETLAQGADGGVAEMRRAIGAAHAGVAGWSGMTADKRAALLSKAAQLMTERSEDLARVLTQENGKPLPESRGEVAVGASFFQWNAEEARRIYGEVVPTIANDRRVL